MEMASNPSSLSGHWGVGLGCSACAFFQDCGGIFDDYDCRPRCCGEPKNCTFACPWSDGFARVLSDSGGWGHDGPWHIRQAASGALPIYLPLIQHGYRRTRVLDWPVVALSTFAAIRAARAALKSNGSGSSLRERFGLSAGVRIVLVSVAPDRFLERYWKLRLARGLPELLSQLGAEHVTAPNFSFFLDVPRPDHMTNRRRSLICAQEFSRAGLSVIPHLNAVTERDWDIWRDILRERTDIVMVCKEFQTGGAIKRVANWHIDKLVDLEQRLGRRLHLVAVGGGRHLRAFAGLSSFSVVDSSPFMRTCFRRVRPAVGGSWILKRTRAGAPLDSLLLENVRNYFRRVESLATRCRQTELHLSGSPWPLQEAANVGIGSRDSGQHFLFPSGTFQAGA
jgi:hypothetical protein